MTETEVMGRVAKQVATWYFRRTSSTEYRDLEQEAWQQILIAADYYPGDHSDSHRFGGYLYRAASKSMGRYLWQTNSPVSVHQKQVPTTATEYEDERTTGRASTPERYLLATEGQAEVPRLREALYARVETLYARHVKKGSEALDGALRVLLENQAPAEAALDSGCSLKDLYRTTERLKARCLADRTVRNILTQIVDRRSDIDQASE